MHSSLIVVIRACMMSVFLCCSICMYELNNNGDDVMHRTLSTAAESGSSFRMTQLLLPTALPDSELAPPDRLFDHGRAAHSDLLPPPPPRLGDAATAPSRDDSQRRRFACRSPDDCAPSSWRNSIKFDTNDCRSLDSSSYRSTFQGQLSSHRPTPAVSIGYMVAQKCKTLSRIINKLY